MVKVVIIGIAGRMGRTVLRVVHDTEGIRCIGGVEQPDHPLLGVDINELIGLKPCGVRVSADLEEVIPEADVLIDFSHPEASLKALEVASKHAKAMVIGTTGFTPEQQRAIESFVQKVPCVLSPNMSLGVNLLFKLVEIAARVLGRDYDVEILEIHHRHKKDAPSGTALRLGQVASAALEKDFEQSTVFGRKGLTGPRPPDQLGIMALRGGDVIGDHTVFFLGEGERLELVHRASSREAFARGAVKAAFWVVGKPPGLYDMLDVLGLKALGF